MLVVQLFNRERRQFKEFDKLNTHLLDSNIEAVKVFAYFFPIVSFLSTLAVALLIWYGSGEVLQKDGDVGRAGGFLPVYGSSVPAYTRPGGEVQYYAGGDGCRRTRVHAC